MAELSAAPAAEMRYAGFWSRFVAGLIDAVVWAPLFFLTYWLERFSYTGVVIATLKRSRRSGGSTGRHWSGS